MKEFVEKLIGRLEELKSNPSEKTCRENILLAMQKNLTIYSTIEIVNQLAEEYKDKVIIDGQYCWQTCACTEKCNECNRLTLTSSDIDWYENIEDWTEEYRPRTNADFIRKMNDEELAELFMKLAWNGEVQTTPLRYLDWLKSEVKGSE